MKRQLVAGSAVLALVLGLFTGIATGDTLLVESFQNSTVSNPASWVAGGSGGTATGWPGEACLTAGTDTTQAPIKGCGLTSPDAAGSGALRLTPDATGRAGFALFNESRPSSSGLDISFRQSQWGGSGADGISFFLVDGATNLTQPGTSGGALGYSAGTSATTPGVANGLVGIGLDLFGNFSDPGAAGTGCAAGTGAGSNGPGQSPNRVAIRGSGNGTVGYCWLGMSPDLATLTPSRSLDGGTTRTSGERLVRIVFDPSTVTTRNVTVYLDGTMVLQVPAPQALIDAANFKFGFGAATGGLMDNHEVWGLTIESVNPVTTTTAPPATTTTAPPATTTTAPPAVAGEAQAADPVAVAPRLTG